MRLRFGKFCFKYRIIFRLLTVVAGSLAHLHSEAWQIIIVYKVEGHLADILQFMQGRSDMVTLSENILLDIATCSKTMFIHLSERQHSCQLLPDSWDPGELRRQHRGSPETDFRP